MGEKMVIKKSWKIFRMIEVLKVVRDEIKKLVGVV